MRSIIWRIKAVEGRGVKRGRWKMGDGRWEMGDGRWKIEDGRWEMEDGRWKVEDGSLPCPPPQQRGEELTRIGFVFLWKMVDGKTFYCSPSIRPITLLN
ncbi:MAG: hypothetical protein WEF53_04370, partial [Bacteroidota bacterium]